MNEDKELLTLAAKAARMSYPKWNEVHNYMMIGLGSDTKEWNPLTDDGDALRLAVKLDMTITCTEDEAIVSDWFDGCETREEHYGSDKYAATCRAIVRAAAEIGRGME